MNPTRPPVIVGNWKMNKTASEATRLVTEIVQLVPSSGRARVVLAPPFTALSTVAPILAPTARFHLGAQHVFWEDAGPFTGEISPPMLKELGCSYVILGHSERRHHFHEEDRAVNRKVHAALRVGLTPIMCLGETLPQREAGHTEEVVAKQLVAGLDGLTKEHLPSITIAYEPVWAIGTGTTATVPQAEAVHRLLRKTLAHHWGVESANQVPLLYGGSVSPTRAEGLLASPEIDGALVGGSCLDPNAFATIIKFADG